MNDAILRLKVLINLARMPVVKTTIMCIFIVVFFQSCSVVRLTFNGVNLPSEVKSIYISTFYNDVYEGPANLEVLFSEELRDFYQKNTPLRITNTDADLELGGLITKYDLTPIAPSGGEDQRAELQRLTIEVKVFFTNNYESDKGFEDRYFSYFSEFDANTNLSDVEDELIVEIFDQIIFDVFNSTVADW